MDQIQKNIVSLSDEELLDQYLNHQNDFTKEAGSFIKEEIQKRGLAIETLKDPESQQDEEVEYDDKDFIQLEHFFNKIELELAVTVLRENKIIFYVDNPTSSATIPTESEADKQYTLHIYNKNITATHELLDEHFEVEEGKYLLKNRSAVDRLNSISFNQLQVSEQDAATVVEVEFSAEEKQFIIKQGKTIFTSADEIEKNHDRVIFFYDMIESLLDKLSAGTSNEFTKTELLAILEIFQIAVQLSTFPGFMEEAAVSLMNLFMK